MFRMIDTTNFNSAPLLQTANRNAHLYIQPVTWALQIYCGTATPVIVGWYEGRT